MKIKNLILSIGFGIYPIIFLYNYNKDFIRFYDIFRPIFLSIAIIISLYLILYKTFNKNAEKALTLTAIISILFFTYGHIYELSENLRHRFLIPIWIGLFILAYLQVKKSSKVAPWLVDFISFVGLLLVVFSSFQIISGFIQLIPSNDHPPRESYKDNSPDIYYIVADGYSRGDVLMDQFNFDNSAFLKKLENEGFYIADCSLTNYSWTFLSVTSTLNLDYLETKDEAYHDAFNDAYIWDILNEHGYTTIVLDNDFSRTMVIDSDVYLKDFSSNDKLQYTFSDFEFMLIKTSATLILTDGLGAISDSIYEKITAAPLNIRYEKTTSLIKNLKLIANLYQSPKFVYAHIMVPHDPFIFSPDGELIPEEKDMEKGYINSVKYLNSELLSIIDSILSTSDEPPIIIIQSDHGWPLSPKESRMPILNTYYLPAQSDVSLYETITPVNTFRLLFNTYLEKNFDILEDISYYTNHLQQEIEDGEIFTNNCVSD